MGHSIFVERIELFEERLGVSLDGLFVVWDPSSLNPGGGFITVTGEVHANSGMTIPQSLRLVVSVHDDSGKVLGMDNHIWLLAEKFFGFEAFQIVVILSDRPSKVRVYPKAL